MEKAEIVAGLRSAMSRGYSLEFAKKSFINAGYNLQDVEDSASILVSGGAGVSSSSSISISSKPISLPLAVPSQASSQFQVQPQTAQQQAYPAQLSSSRQAVSPSAQIQPSPYKPLPRMPSQSESYKRTTDEIGRPRRRGLWLVIILIVIFLIVLGVLGLLIFKREIVEAWLGNWGLI